MLTVVTPAAGNRLTTLTRARAALGFTGDRDVLADRCIDAASAAIADWCRRPFGAATWRETFDAAAGPESVLLGRGPVTSFVSVLHADASLASTEYSLDQDTGRLFRQDAAGHLFRWWGRVVVEYAAGFSLPADNGTWTLPATVERAAILLVASYLAATDRDPLIRSETVEGIGSMSWWVPGSAGLSCPEAEALLHPYRRLA